MLEELNVQIPQDRRVILVGDTEYACREVVRNLPERMVFVGPMAMDAALYDPPPEKKSGRGRPRKKGRRLKSPKQLIKDRGTPWKPHEMMLYGRRVMVLIKTQTCLWYTVTRTVPFILTVYALVILWYFGNGSWQEDVERARRRAPRYREKIEPSFGDMLGALRRQLWTEHCFSEPSTGQGAAKINTVLLECLCAA
jgi:hypothetical protein